MTQDVILKKFIVFSNIQYAKHQAEWEDKKKLTSNPEELKKISDQQADLKKNHDKLIKALEQGYCFGFSVVDGAMHWDGMLLWWRSLLQTIAVWDEKPESLKKRIVLPSEKNERVPEKYKNTSFYKKRRKLEQLTDRAMNYVVLSQCDGGLSFAPKLMHQGNFLKPDGFKSEKNPAKNKSYHEYTNHKKIFTIKNRKVITGHFTHKQLCDIFTKKNKLGRSMIFVHGSDHTIRMTQVGSVFFIYNSNYDHTKVETMQFQGTRKECMAEIVKTLGNALCFEVVSYHSKNKITLPVYDKMVESNLFSLFEGCGIFSMARYTPDELLVHLKKAEFSPSLRDGIIERCKNFFSYQFRYDLNSLQSMMENNSRILPLVLRLAKSSPYYEEVRLDIARALIGKDNKNNPPLVALIKYAPQNIIALLDFLLKEDDKTALLLIFNLLTDTNKKDLPLWSVLNKVPQHKEKIFNFLLKKMTGIDFDFYAKIPMGSSLSFPELLLKAFTLELNSGIKGQVLQAVLLRIPEVLPVLFEHLLDVPNGCEQFISVLNAKNHDTGPSHWDKLKVWPQQRNQILELFVEHIKKMDEKTLKMFGDKFRINFFCRPSFCQRLRYSFVTESLSLNSIVLKEVDNALERLKLRPNLSVAGYGFARIDA